MTTGGGRGSLEGGRLTLETADMELGGPTRVATSRCRPDPIDTGLGMDEETRSRVFEPFFTTEDPGKGTGPGLATVYGIVEQSGGGIQLCSERGRGTSFKIYLPRVAEAATAPDHTRATTTAAPRDDETVQLVEDQPEVRDLAREILEAGGYRVLQAWRRPGGDADVGAPRGRHPPAADRRHRAAAERARSPSGCDRCGGSSRCSTCPATRTRRSSALASSSPTPCSSRSPSRPPPSVEGRRDARPAAPPAASAATPA